MKIELNKGESRKLVAVIGADKKGIFLPSHSSKSVVYVTPNGTAEARDQDGSLEAVLSVISARTPVYEGDTVTLTF